MTCNDCIHYEVCANFSDLGIGTLNEDECGTFKDKSPFVELPCKVGGTIYHVDTYKGATVKENVVSEIRITDKGIAYFALTEDGVFAFRSEAIGRDVFLTREEAEQKLEEMKR